MRRDFTINALAMSPNGKIYDLCDGTKDLENHVIRAIGNPKIRFKEDPLRILRAFRLISKLDFYIEPKTVKGIMTEKKDIEKLTEAKVVVEMTKIFQGQYAVSALKQMVNAGVTAYLPFEKHALKLISSNMKKISVEEAYAICYRLAGAVSEKANFSQNTVKRLQQIIELSKLIENDPVTDVIVFKYGSDIAYSANRINRIINGLHYKDQEKMIKKIEASQPIAKPSELAFKGQDLLILTNGKQGPFFTKILDELKYKVVTKAVPNDFYRLREEAIKLLDEYKLDLKPETKAPEARKVGLASTRQEQPAEEPYKVPLLSDDDDSQDEQDTGLNDNDDNSESLNQPRNPYANDSINKNINYNNNNNENNRPISSYGANAQNNYPANNQNSYPVNTQNNYSANYQNGYPANLQNMYPGNAQNNNPANAQGPAKLTPAIDSFPPAREPDPVVNQEMRHVGITPAPNTYIINANLGEKAENPDRVHASPAKDYNTPAPIPDARYHYANANPAPVPDARFAGAKPAEDQHYNYNNYIPIDNNYGKNSYSPHENGPISETDLHRKEEELRIQWQILMKERFKLDYEKMIQANIANLPNANTLTPEQKANLASQMGPSIRQMLININLDYQKLAKEGII
jgi:tRNA nucleotidyltransferase (CCA-adding enzyme)